MKKLSIHISSVILVAGLSLAACDGGGVSSRVRDRQAYNLGMDHAARAVSLHDDPSALQDYLLDVRARMNNISARVGRQAATDYERGFIDGVTAADESLARELF